MKNAFAHTSISLLSPEKTPFPFYILITEKGQAVSFEVTQTIPGKNSGTRSYILPDRSHASYLNLFEQLAQDFGLRLPQNRRKKTAKAAQPIQYKELLTENIHEDILFGYGDPAVLKTKENHSSVFYLAATSNDAPNAFPLLKSTDLKNWLLVDFIFRKDQKPDWTAVDEYASDFWAPEIHQVNNEFRLYFVARDKYSLELCIGMAKAERPEGLYISEPEPILKNNVIDPHLFVDESGTSYLLWKEDNNEKWPNLLIAMLFDHPELLTTLFEKEEDQLAASFIVTLWPWIKNLEPMEKFQVEQILIEAVISDFMGFQSKLSRITFSNEAIKARVLDVMKFIKTPMFIQQLSPDGTKLVGERTKIIENDLDWEAHLVEGMWLTKHHNKFYLFYAGNDFSTDQYGIGVALSDNLLGPYSKLRLPLLKSTEKWLAPGHPSITQLDDGSYRMILHAYFPGEAGYKRFRALLSVRIEFGENEVRILD